MCNLLLNNLYACDVGVSAVVPVEEAFNINLVADFKLFYSLVNVCISAAKIGLNEELIFLAVKLYVEVEIVALGACAVPFIEICNVVASISLEAATVSPLKETNWF